MIGTDAARISCALLISAAALAQTPVNTSSDLGSGSGTLDSGITLKYKTVVEPPVKHSAFIPAGGAFRAKGNTMRHVIYDRAATSYFGYEMLVLPGDDATSRRITFGPLNTSEMRDVLRAVAGDLPLNSSPQPKFPGPQVVFDGDTIALDLMISPDGRERIVDYIQFVFGPKTTKPPAAATAEPRDFTIDDGPVTIGYEPPEVTIDGEKFPRTIVMMAPRDGVTLWYYVPGRGRYVLSLAQHDGFVKAGTVRANVISFHEGGQLYQIRLDKPIAGTEKAWNLYVLLDHSYLPRAPLVNLIVGGADRLENLLPKQ